MHNSHLLLLSLWYKEQRMPTKGSEGEETKRAETMHVNRWVFGRSAHKDSCGCCTGTGRHRLKGKESRDKQGRDAGRRWEETMGWRVFDSYYYFINGHSYITE